MLQPILNTIVKGMEKSVYRTAAIRYRRYRRSDLEAILRLFHETIHTICIQDYTSEQLEAWAPSEANKNAWARSFRNNLCYVAEYQGEIVGFGDIVSKGNEINRLYTHKDFQGMGVASRIIQQLEQAAVRWGHTEIILESSLSAKGFYESRGFECKDVVKKLLNHQIFYNYLMVKSLRS